jgi:hypothetical protein
VSSVETSTTSQGHKVHGLYLLTLMSFEGLTSTSGAILCRLPGDSSEIREVGKLLRTKFASVCFTVTQNGMNLKDVPIPIKTIETMIADLQFDLPATFIQLAQKTDNIDLLLRLADGDTYSISGFPRLLLGSAGRSRS